MKDPQVGAVGTKKASSRSEVCTEGIISSLQTSGSLIIIILVPFRVKSVFFFIVFGFFHYRCDIYISFLKKTRAKINAKQVNRIKCYSEIFFFCNLGNAIINHSSYKKGQGVNESMVCFIITWRGGGKPLFRFLIVGRLAWYWYWYSLTTIPENFR